MIDLPPQQQQPAVVHECTIQAKENKTYEEQLRETDLSFYNILACGMCSGSSSSVSDTITASTEQTDD